MPKTDVQIERKSIRIPKHLVEEVDSIVKKSRLYLNRQQFIESAIREKIENLDSLNGKVTSIGLNSSFLNTFQSSKDDLLIGVKESFLMHTIVSLVKGKNIPNDHLSSRSMEEKIKSFIKRKAEIEGKQLTEKQVIDLTNNLLEYHKGILQGTSIIDAWFILGHIL